jgi:hypothetical protein
MPGFTIINVPHTLGREEARRRLRTRVGELPSHIPGGLANVRSSWPGENTMALEVAAMGQQVSCMLDVQDRSIRVSLVLPPMLSFLSGAIAAAVRDRGNEFLLGADERS